MLRLALLQSELHWESVEDNLRLFSDQIRRLPEVDLIVLPEMFSTGFSMSPELAVLKKPNTRIEVDGEYFQREILRPLRQSLCGR